MPTGPQIAGIARTVAGGRVFTHFRFDEEDIQALVADLNYASNPAVIQSAARVKEYGEQVLEYLKRRFPSKNRTAAAAFSMNKLMGQHSYEGREPLNLREGWRVHFYSAATLRSGVPTGGGSLWGFYIRHALERSERIRTILLSLEEGSKSYTIRPIEGDALALPERYPSSGKLLFRASARIPARKGFRYIEETRKFADQLLARHGTYVEDELQRIIEKGARLKQIALGQSLGSGELLDSVAETPAVISALAKQKNPLKAVKHLKRRFYRRRR